MVSPRVETPALLDDRRCPPPPSSPVRWQRMRLTLLQAQVLDRDVTVADHERLRLLEHVAAKASAFGGRILELGPLR